MNKKTVLASCLMLLSAVVLAQFNDQQRIIAANDGNKIAESGEAEIVVKCSAELNALISKKSMSYAVYLNGKLAAQVLPFQQEKIVVKNSSYTLEVQTLEIYKKKGWIGLESNKVRITCNANSNRNTIVISENRVGSPAPKLTIVDTSPLSDATQYIAAAPAPAPVAATPAPTPVPVAAAPTPVVAPIASPPRARYALVIGNNTYKHGIPPLTNPVNDATAIAAALKDLSYSVELYRNADLIQMEDAIKKFMAKLTADRDSEGFFWFAGHGVSTEERAEHYLLPVDANPDGDSRIRRTGYAVNDLLAELEKVHNRTNLIVLDACRNTLTASGRRAIGTRGLSVVGADQVQGNKVVYSTAAGATASDGDPKAPNSPFAAAFLKHMKAPEPFNDVFVDIYNETLQLTGGQRPITVGDFSVKGYSLNAEGAR